MKDVSILGCGWLGMPLAKHLVSLGYKVNGSTTREEKLRSIEETGAEPFIVDLAKNRALPEAFLKASILIIAVPPGSWAEDALRDCMENIQQQWSGNILLVSSTSVYPDLNREVVEEDASIEAKTRKGLSLLKIEQVFNTQENTILRFSGLIGPDRHPGRWFAGKENLKGGNTPINMIHLQDCIGIIETIIKRELWGDAYNACSPEHPFKKDYYPAMCENLGLSPCSYSDDDQSDWKVVSSEKLVRHAGYQFKKSVFEVST